jgi:anti-anti-sigma factor
VDSGREAFLHVGVGQVMANKSQLLIDVYRARTELLVELTGRLTLDNSETVRKRLHELIEDPLEKFYLYMGGLEYVDSGGWGTMVGLKVAVNRNRTRLTFLAPNDRVMDIFRISKLDSIFDIITGVQAETIRKTIERPENLVWRDSPDESQSKFNTEAYFTPYTEDTASPPGDSRGDSRGSSEISELSKRAVEYLRFGDYTRVVETYMKVLEIDPDDIAALNNLGVVYEKRPEWRDKAEETWERVRDLSELRKDGKHADRARRHLKSLRGEPR